MGFKAQMICQVIYSLAKMAHLLWKPLLWKVIKFLEEDSAKAVAFAVCPIMIWLCEGLIGRIEKTGICLAEAASSFHDDRWLWDFIYKPPERRLIFGIPFPSQWFTASLYGLGCAIES